MDQRVDMDKLGDALKDALQTYVDSEVIAEVKEEAQRVAKEAQKNLRKKTTGKFKDRTGSYRKGWRVKKISETANTIELAVWNATDYQLTHLLEHGHLCKNGTGRSFGDVKAYEHIAEVNEYAARLFEGNVERIIQGKSIRR